MKFIVFALIIFASGFSKADDQTFFENPGGSACQVKKGADPSEVQKARALAKSLKEKLNCDLDVAWETDAQTTVQTDGLQCGDIYYYSKNCKLIKMSKNAELCPAGMLSRFGNDTYKACVLTKSRERASSPRGSAE